MGLLDFLGFNKHANNDLINNEGQSSYEDLLKILNQSYDLYKERYPDAYKQNDYYFNSSELFAEKFTNRSNMGYQYQEIYQLIREEPKLDYTGRSYEDRDDLSEFRQIIYNKLKQPTIADWKFLGKDYLIGYLETFPREDEDLRKKGRYRKIKNDLIKKIIKSKTFVFDLGIYLLLHELEYDERLKILKSHPECVFFQDMVIKAFLEQRGFSNFDFLEDESLKKDLESSIIKDLASSISSYFGKFNKDFWQARILHAIVSRAFYISSGTDENFKRILKYCEMIEKIGGKFPGVEDMKDRINYRASNDRKEPKFNVKYSYAVGPWWFDSSLYSGDDGMMLLGYYEICGELESKYLKAERTIGDNP